MCEAILSSSFQSLHIGFSTVSPLLRLCFFRLQCSVTSPVTFFRFVLFRASLALSFVGILSSCLLGLWPSIYSKCFECRFVIHSRTSALVLFLGMPRIVSGPILGCSVPCLARASAFSFPISPLRPGT